MIEMFLCSYFAGAATLFEDYARQNVRAKEVLFIPTAANVEEYRDYVDEAKEAFAKMGFEVQILDVSKASEAEAKATPFIFCASLKRRISQASALVASEAASSCMWASRRAQ